MAWVSVTGLRLKGPLNVFRFFWHAIPSKAQADRAKGCLRAEVKALDGMQHTLTVWDSRQDMLLYRNNGAHLKAMKVFRKIATGRIYGFEHADTKIGWDEALDHWRKFSKEY